MHLSEKQWGKIVWRRRHGLCGHEVSKIERACEGVGGDQGAGAGTAGRRCRSPAAPAAPGPAAPAPQRSRKRRRGQPGHGRGGEPEPRASEPRGAKQAASPSLPPGHRRGSPGAGNDREAAQGPGSRGWAGCGLRRARLTCGLSSSVSSMGSLSMPGMAAAALSPRLRSPRPGPARLRRLWPAPTPDGRAPDVPPPARPASPLARPPRLSGCSLAGGRARSRAGAEAEGGVGRARLLRGAERGQTGLCPCWGDCPVVRVMCVKQSVLPALAGCAPGLLSSSYRQLFWGPPHGGGALLGPCRYGASLALFPCYLEQPFWEVSSFTCHVHGSQVKASHFYCACSERTRGLELREGRFWLDIRK